MIVGVREGKRGVRDTEMERGAGGEEEEEGWWGRRWW